MLGGMNRQIKVEGNLRNTFIFNLCCEGPGLRRRWESSFFSVYHPFSGQGGIEINGRGIYLKGGETRYYKKLWGV